MVFLDIRQIERIPGIGQTVQIDQTALRQLRQRQSDEIGADETAGPGNQNIFHAIHPFSLKTDAFAKTQGWLSKVYPEPEIGPSSNQVWF
jgi:hypothetical protein